VKDLAEFLPACVTAARRLRRHPAGPTSVKVAVAFAALWCISPIDLIPEFLPVIGPLDDVIVVALALRYAARRIPREVLVEACGQPRRHRATPRDPRSQRMTVRPRAVELFPKLVSNGRRGRRGSRRHNDPRVRRMRV
jgi:uncharacterized membrane protein YkvA (DUF1232 family)